MANLKLFHTLLNFNDVYPLINRRYTADSFESKVLVLRKSIFSVLSEDACKFIRIDTIKFDVKNESNLILLIFSTDRACYYTLLGHNG